MVHLIVDGSRVFLRTRENNGGENYINASFADVSTFWKGAGEGGSEGGGNSVQCNTFLNMLHSVWILAICRMDGVFLRFTSLLFAIEDHIKPSKVLHKSVFLYTKCICQHRIPL